MRRTVRSTLTAGIVLGVVATLAATPVASAESPLVVTAVQTSAAPELGAIPTRFLRNQFEYCSVICPYVVQGAVQVPLAAVLTPGELLAAIGSGASVLQALGVAAASVTGPANAAAGPIIDNDLTLVLPKAQNALQVTVVELLNIADAVTRPADLGGAVDTARRRITGALDQPIGVPVGPTGAETPLQVVAVEVINVVSAVAFQAGELALLGVVQTADAAARELARTGNPAAALTAGLAQAQDVAGAASARVTEAVDTAVINVAASLRGGSSASPATADQSLDSDARQAATTSGVSSDAPDAKSPTKSKPVTSNLVKPSHREADPAGEAGRDPKADTKPSSPERDSSTAADV